MKSPARLFTAMLQDEAPSMGSGLRFIFVKEGRKWVYLLNPFTMRTARLKWAVWEKCKPLLVDDEQTRARVIASVKRNLERSGAAPTLLQQQALGEEK